MADDILIMVIMIIMVMVIVMMMTIIMTMIVIISMTSMITLKIMTITLMIHSDDNDYYYNDNVNGLL